LASQGGTSAGILIEELQVLIPKLMAEALVPGLAVALVQDGQLSWRGTFGVRDRDSQERVDDDTVFEAASVSKTVFAYAVLKLCETGVLTLDTPLTEYTPQRWIAGDPRLDVITARHVLSHTSGFQDWRSGKEPLKIHFTPGTKFLYSGEGYNYLQSVVTHLTGHVNRENCAKYEDDFEVCATDISPYLKKRLLSPFNMPSSGYVWNDAWQRHAARPHDAEGKPLTKKKPTATDAARYASAGGLHTTATEYARFLIEVVNPKPSDSCRLSLATWKEMLRPQIKLGPEQKIDGATSWALGWAVQERASGPVIVHSGGQEGFQCLTMASVGKQSGFVILTNSNNGWKVFHHPAFQDATDKLI
jgi:CubicO group peptidase (beta-lactamase class C family)